MVELVSERSREMLKQGNCFDMIRYYLAFVVVFAHFSILSGANNFNWITNSGEAVSGFFTLSGFLVFYSFIRKPSLKTYAVKRIRRIFPPYFFIIALCVVGGAFLSVLSSEEYFSSSMLYNYIAANCSFLNFIEPNLPGVFGDNVMRAVNGSLWTMKVELMLYASVPIAYFFFKRFSKVTVLAVIFVLSIVYREFFLYLYETEGKELYNILARQVGSQLVYFYSGTAILLYFEQFQRYVKYLLPAALILYAGRYYVDALQFLEPFSFAVLIIGIAYNVKFLNVFSRFENVSYGIYLFHFPVIQTIVHFRLHEYSYMLAIVTAIVATVALACFSWNFIEKPILHKGKVVPSNNK